ncbi:MAG: helix-turn-helix transcriptional regulator [Rhodocyclaceae bacterium]|nr:helix-turn-helix transcriptional regulator [Rhodocyclaceae bacterium]
MAESKNNLPKVLQKLRKLKHLSQEDFSIVSSRTYISTLERGLQSPTVEKLEQLATVYGVSVPAMLILAFSLKRAGNFDRAVVHGFVEEAMQIIESSDR